MEQQTDGRMIDVTKQYKTRDGREVTQLTRFDVKGSYPVVGVNDGTVRTWTVNGQYRRADDDSRYDLIEVKPRIKRDVWVNVCGGGFTRIYGSRGLARSRFENDCALACVRVSLDCEQGEGL